MKVHWYHLSPVVALAYFAFVSVFGNAGSFIASPFGITTATLLIPVLFAAVFAAVHHAEIIAHSLGEPYGTLVLTLSVMVIEVSLIASIMLSESPSPALARDTVFSVIMIVCNGLVGICLLVGGLRYGEQEFVEKGAAAYLVVLIALGTLTLILPNYTLSESGPVFAYGQLVFVSVVTLLLYGVFLYTQTVRHRDYFVLGQDVEASTDGRSSASVLNSAIWLFLSVLAVLLLAKKFASVLEAGMSVISAPMAAAGTIVALLILAPEIMAAINAAGRNQLQRSLNLALGSSLATIGLTIPAVAVVNTLALKQSLVLGLGQKDIVLLVLTFVICIVTFGTGRTNILFGFVHLVIFATYLFLIFVP